MYWPISILAFIYSCHVIYANIDPSKCIISGPGIDNPKFHMPVRYFYVKLIDHDGKRLNRSAGDAYLIMDNLDQASCSIWSKILDMHDGSYLIRYKLFKTCAVLKLAITTPDGKHLAKSPYLLKGPLYPELCTCPVPIDHWLTAMACPGNYAQIDEDLKPWAKRSVNFTWVLEEAAQKWAVHPGAYSYCHYVIVNNQISRKCYGQHVGFNMFSDSILLSITRKVNLPNMQFLMNLGDWPLEKRINQIQIIPMFSWCGSNDSKDIVLPTYELTESTLEMMGRQSLDIFSAENFAKIPWHEKIDIGFWRGRDSSEERLRLVSVSRKFPELLDAAITRFFFFRDRMDEYGPETPVVGFDHFFKYKYQITLDGTVAAYRLAYLLAGNSLVMKQESPYYEYFYRNLKPWKHYVPIKRDLSDLIEKIQWARDHDTEAKEISRRAQIFVRNHLNPKEIFCYHVKALKELSDRLTDPPVQLPIGDGFEKVEQPVEAGKCHCENGQKNEDMQINLPADKQISKDEL